MAFIFPFLHASKQGIQRNAMKKTSYIFATMREYLYTAEFTALCKMAKTDFVRNRLLSCQVLVLFILNLLKQSIANELIYFCKTVSMNMVTRGAISKARFKLSPQAFVALNNVLLREFYTDNPVRTFCGFIVMAIDGSMLELPVSCTEIQQYYGGATNQTDRVIPMARTSWLYDVVNGVTFDAMIEPYCTAERDMAFQHIDKLKNFQSQCKNQNDFLLLFDRGYPSAPLIIYLLKQSIHFLMRCNGKFIREVDDAVASGKRDTIIKFKGKRAGAAQKLLQRLLPGLIKDDVFSLRVLIVTLKTGEKEILITSLLEKERYPYKMFQELYFKRWGVEENYKFQKVLLAIENFSGKSKIAIEQDFHATVLASNSYALLALEAQMETEQDNDQDLRKYKYKINRNVGKSALKNEFINMLIDPKACIETFCYGIKQTMKKNLIPIRPGRKFERKRRYPHHKWHMNLR
jgi:hypothetical protein